MGRERDRLEQLRRWRQAAVWAPVLWFPLLLCAMAMGDTLSALVLGFAGLVFSGLARSIVWFGRCPRCAARFRDSEQAFRRIWDASTCAGCGLSLFELRRSARPPGGR